MKTQHNLFVCTTCATVWKDGKPEGKSGGDRLLEQLTHLAQDWSLRDDFKIEPVKCMRSCSHSCAISFVSYGKYTYLFGDLSAEDSAAAILECACQYYNSSDGDLPWSLRPEPLKNGILGRIPSGS